MKLAYPSRSSPHSFYAKKLSTTGTGSKNLPIQQLHEFQEWIPEDLSLSSYYFTSNMVAGPPGGADSCELKQIADKWHPDKVQQIAKRWELSAQEVGQLNELGDRVIDVRHEMNDPEEMVRFLKDAKKVKDAEKMFRNFIDFRRNQMDSILEDFEPHPLLKSHFPMTLLNAKDKQGDGIWLERPGCADLLGLYERFGKDDLLKYALYVREQAAQSQWTQDYKERNNCNPRCVAIIDVQGMNRRHMRPCLLPIIAHAVQLIQDYYCGFIKKIIVIREPALFRLLWSMIKGFFNQNMKDVIVFAGSDYKRVLAEYIDDLEEALPPCILEGGRGTIAEGMPQRMEGGAWSAAEAAPLDKLLKDNSTTSATEDCSSWSSEYLEEEAELLPEERFEFTGTVHKTPIRVTVQAQTLAGGSF